MHIDSIKDFKDKYYIIRPEIEGAHGSVLRRVPVTDEEGLKVLDEYGQARTKLTSMFPFR